MAFNLYSDYTPSGGAVAAAANPGSIGNGWTDANGNRWYINASNQLSQNADGGGGSTMNQFILARLVSAEFSTDTQISVTYTAGPADLFAVLRNVNAGSFPCYYANQSGIYVRQNSSTFTQVSSFSPTIALVNGTDYNLTFSAVQTNGTTSTLRLTIVRVSDSVTVSDSGNVTNTTGYIQNISGGCGFWFNGSVTTPPIVKRVQTYLQTAPAAATSYAVTIANAGSVGTALRGSVTPVGGSGHTSPLVVTIADASGGTFTNIPVTLTNASTGANFTYTPGSIGTKSLVATHTGGNSGQTDPAASSVAVSDPSAPFIVNSDYTPTGGAVAAAAAPGSIGNGWTDVAGNRWSITGANKLQQANFLSGSGATWNTYGLARIIPADYSTNLQIVVRITHAASQPLFVVLRTKNTSSTVLSYYATSGTIYARQNSTTLVTVSNIAGTTPLVDGTDYIYTFSCIQLNSTTTRLRLIVKDVGGTTFSDSGNVDDTTSFMQNVTGGYGLFYTTNPSPTANSAVVRLQTYLQTAPASATGFTVSLPSTGSNGIPMRGSITLTGGVALTASLVVNITDATGGAFTGIPVTLPSASTGISFIYTPATVGTKSLPVTHTGGNGGMTGDTTLTPSILALTIIRPTDAACKISPYNWAPGTTPSTVQCVKVGAYAVFWVKNCSYVTFLFDTTSSNLDARFYYSIDGGVLSRIQPIPAGGQYQVNFADTNPHYIEIGMDRTTSGDRFSRTNYMGLQGLILSAGGSPAPESVVRGTKRIIIYTDSNGEGFESVALGNSAHTYAWAYMASQAFRFLGYEVGMNAWGGQGYSIGAPPLFNPLDDSDSSWNKVDVSTPLTSGGMYIQQPDIVYINMGGNDLSGGNTGNALTPPLASRVATFYRTVRAAAPGALIVVSINVRGAARADVQSAFTQYQSTNNDARAVLIDTKTDPFILNGAWSNPDFVHMTTYGHSNYGPLQVAGILNAASGSSSSFASGTQYPVGLPIGRFTTGTINVSVPWSIPANGIPGATGAAQSGSTSFGVSTEVDSETELCNLLDRMVTDGRATIL